MVQRSPLFLDTGLGVARPALAANGDTLDAGLLSVKGVSVGVAGVYANMVVPFSPCTSPGGFTVTSASQIIFKAAPKGATASSVWKVTRADGTTVLATGTLAAGGQAGPQTGTVALNATSPYVANGEVLLFVGPATADATASVLACAVTGS